MEDKGIEQLALEADEPIEKAIAYLHRKASEQYLKSTGFSASPFGLDGVPHVRFRAIAQAMLDYHSELVLDEYPKAQELLEPKWISVDERLPEVGLVLGFQNDEIYVSFYDAINKPRFTHYQPLPSPPQLKDK